MVIGATICDSGGNYCNNINVNGKVRVTTIVMVGRGEIISGNNKSGGNND